MLLTTLRAMKLEHVRMNGDCLLFRFGPKDGDSGFEVRRGEIPIRPHSNRLRRRSSSVRIALAVDRTKARLLAVFVDALNVWKKLFLGPFFVGDELDVVDQSRSIRR